MISQYCSQCGKAIGPGEVTYPDLDKWREEYREAKAEGWPTPEIPAAGTVCCGVLPIFPPAPDIPTKGPPPLELGATRVGSFDFGTMIKVCNAIGKSLHSIKAYLRLDMFPDLFGPSGYYIDVKAERTKEKIRELMPPVSVQIEEG